MKLCTTGLMALAHLERLACQAKWVGLGSFGFDVSLICWNHLPKGSQIVVGFPREEVKHSSMLYRLQVFKKRRPDLVISVRKDFHAKYGLFRMARSQIVMVGSANCTPSPAHEVVAFFQDEGLYHAISKKHTHWLTYGELVQPDVRVPLSPAQLWDLRHLPSTGA